MCQLAQLLRVLGEEARQEKSSFRAASSGNEIEGVARRAPQPPPPDVQRCTPRAKAAVGALARLYSSGAAPDGANLCLFSFENRWGHVFHEACVTNSVEFALLRCDAQGL